jgi:predicted AlkP superfamily phosphohydrolase/phosphomutase
MEDPAKRRVLVVGLDCAAPRFVFGPGAYDLPHLRALMERGAWGRLESCHPPITVPAWASMTSGRDPGELGIYGFRNRKDHSYDAYFTANGSAVKLPRLWDILSGVGRKSVVLGVPQTYPVKPLNGWLVAGFLTPDRTAPYTYPRSLKQELEGHLGAYLFDVKDFRTNDKEALLGRLHELLDNRFDAAEFLATSKPWDFFMMVEMGLDRLHHGFWRFCDPDHPRYEPGNPYEHAFRDYYRALDGRIGRLLERVGPETAVLVVSDHGARAMDGGVCINEWLMQEGLLALEERPPEPMRLEDCRIDWSRTRAWSTGGYYGRIFLNVEGREPQGVVPAGEYETFRRELAERIEAMPGPDGRPLGNRVCPPESLYRSVEGVAPDLFVYFGDLGWRGVGTVGGGELFTFENDIGPDDANHDYHGIFILDDGAGPRGELPGLQLMDVAPTVLELMGVARPDAMQGRSVTEEAAT